MKKKNFNIQTWVTVQDFANVVSYLRTHDIYNGSSTSEVLRIIVLSLSEKNKVFDKDSIPEAVNYLQNCGFRLGQVATVRGTDLVVDIDKCLESRADTIESRAEELERIMKE